MHWQYSPYAIPLVAIAVISLLLILPAWRRFPAPGVLPFALLMAGVAEWSLGYALELASVEASAKLLWAKAEYIGIVTLPFAWIVFALDYAGLGRPSRWLSRGGLFGLALVPSLTLFLAWTNEFHGLVWSEVGLERRGEMWMWVVSHGPMFWVHVAYSYSLLLAGTLLLLRALFRPQRLYRGQVGMLLVATLAPWVGNALYITGRSPFRGLDLTPFAFMISGLALAWALFRYRLLDLVPVARGAIIEGMRDGVIVLDGHNRIIDLNPAAARVLGRPIHAVVGRAAAQVLAGWPELVHRCRDATEAQVEIRQDLDGQSCCFDLRVSTLVDRMGRPTTGRLVVLRDITELKRVEEALRRAHDELEARVRARTAELSEANERLRDQIRERERAEQALAAEKERLAVTLRSIGDGVITTDTDGRVVLLNPVAETLTGWTQAEAVGLPLDRVFVARAAQTPGPAESPVSRVLRSGSVVGPEERATLLTRDGTERVIAQGAAPIRTQDGRTMGAVLVFRDITERRRLDVELAHASKLESIGVLAGGIAHDFNNILTTVLANLSLAKVSMDPAERSFGRVAEAEKASLRAKDLTQQLLTFAKGGAPILKPTQLLPVLRDAASFALIGSNVRPEFLFPERLWTAVVDEGQIGQVIQNLVLNAQQAMPQGGTVQLRAENVALTVGPALPLPAGDYIRISVADRGVGIPEEHLAHIFDPFFSTKQDGSGLGLATAYAIVQKHGGHIDVESRAGVGTTFSIFLPASQGLAVERAPVSGRPLPGRGRILVMDDEPTMRETVQAVLDSLGYDAMAAADGEQAVELYRQAQANGRPFDAVILDLTVPGAMGGKEAIHILRTLDAQVKAIVSSGYATDPVMANYRQHGFRGVVAKPYTVEELSLALHRVIAEQDESPRVMSAPG